MTRLLLARPLRWAIAAAAQAAPIPAIVRMRARLVRALFPGRLAVRAAALGASLSVGLLSQPALAVLVPYASEAAFVAAAGALTIESFETSSGTGISSLLTPNFSLSHTGSTFSVLSAPSPFGTFATDGVRYLEEASVATNEFVFSGFAGPLTAFGLNITDYGDFGTASLVMTINGTTSFVIATPSGSGANGSLRYFGVVATAGDSITEVRLRSGDAVGIDKVGISAPAVVPEPMPALLVPLGIAAIAGGRRYTAARSRG